MNKITPLRSLLLLAVAGSGLMLFSGCEGDTVVYRDRPAYYGGGGDDVDFYYVGGRPYSRSYGELVVRDGGYYYNRGGNFVVYDRSYARSPYRGDRYRTADYRSTDYRVQNERNYRNQTVNNYYETNPGSRSRNAPSYTHDQPQRGGYQGQRTPYVRTQIRGAQPVQGQQGQPQYQKKKKKGDDNNH